jgi:hypothetical protein
MGTKNFKDRMKVYEEINDHSSEEELKYERI